jgi:hypothetical protein
VRRLLSTGRVDSSFGVRGLVRIDLGLRSDRGTAVAFAPHGKILLAGTSEAEEEVRGAGESVTVVGRLLPDGAVDKTFSRDGLTILRNGTVAKVDDLASGPDESVIASGGGELLRLRPGGSARHRLWGRWGSCASAIDV